MLNTIKTRCLNPDDTLICRLTILFDLLEDIAENIFDYLDDTDTPFIDPDLIPDLKKTGLLEDRDYEEEELQKRIKEIAEEIDKDYKDSKEIIIISVLKGAVFFTVDLVKKMKTDIILEVMQLSSYAGTESTGNIIVKKDLDCNIEGKHVLIVEDIIDTGRTLKFLKEYLASKNPKSLKVAVLMDKAERREVDVNVDYTGFVIPNKFIVGYGFDYDEKGRNIPYVGYLE